jgi:hypothetical protein
MASPALESLMAKPSFHALRAKALLQEFFRHELPPPSTVPGPAIPDSPSAATVLEGQPETSSHHKTSIKADVEPVGIIGAGVAGLKAAMLLSQAGIPFEIIEASNRVGGRLFTYQFSDQPYDYFDVGAMRYPDIPPMQSTFDLFKELGWVPGGPGRLIPYHLSSSNTVQEFNDIRMQGPPPVDIDANVLPRLYIFLSHTNRHCVQLRAEAQHSRVIKVDCRP